MKQPAHLKAGVMGDPVAHSLSPRLHGYWLKRYGIDGDYAAMHVAADSLEAALRALALDGVAGCNLTIPHKEAGLSLVDEASELAHRIGAVNTVVVRDNGTLYGTNTDAAGFILNLKSQIADLTPYHRKAVVLGAGGAARAVCAALLDDGFAVWLTNRTRAKAEAIAAALGAIDVVDWDAREVAFEGCGLLVNCTSLGLEGSTPLDVSLEALPRDALVTDIVYKPLMTPLLLDAQARGNPVVDGLGMLLYQAVDGFAAWYGVRPEVDAALRAHMLEAL